MKIFCINLERATERRQLIQEKWIENLKLDISFWKAYDKNSIDQNLFIYPYSEYLSIKKSNRKLNNGEIACATSFLQLFEYCLNENIKEVIIMEDDVIPLINNKEELFSKITKAKQEYNVEMILMHKPFIGNNPESVDHLIKMEPGIYYKKSQYSSLCNITPWGNLMFYITSQGMKMILQQTKRSIFMPADYFQKKLCEMNLVSILNEPVCEHYFMGSYIGDQFRFSGFGGTGGGGV